MDASGAHEICFVFFVIIVQITDVLEIVGVYLSFRNGPVRQNVVVVFDDFESISLLCQLIFYYFQDFCVRRRSRSHLDDLFIRFLASAACQCDGRCQS